MPKSQPNASPVTARPSGPALLVITELFLPTKGGTAVWFDELYRRLGGKDTHIVTADVPGAAEHDRNHPNTVHRLALVRYPWLVPESLVMYLKLFFTSAWLAMRHRVSAVHAGRVLPEGFVALAVARLSGRAVVVYAHGEEITTWRQRAKFRAMSYVYRSANIVVANSEFTRHELAKLGVDARRIVLVNPGVDLMRFRPGLPCDDLRSGILRQPGQRLILSVGRLSRRKGFDQVVRALPVLLERGVDAHYVIIGIGPDRDYLARLAAELGVSDRVRLLGHVPPEDLPRWYNAVDVFAMPNREIEGDTEGFGMVFIEAAACGKPSVAGEAGGTGAAVIDGVTGLRVDGTSVAAVVSALECVLTDGELARRLGGQGHQRAIREFGWERVAERIGALESREDSSRNAGPMP